MKKNIIFIYLIGSLFFLATCAKNPETTTDKSNIALFDGCSENNGVITQRLYRKSTSYMMPLKVGENTVLFVADTGSANIVASTVASIAGSDSDKKKDGEYIPLNDAEDNLTNSRIAYGSGQGTLKEFKDKIQFDCTSTYSQKTSFGAIAQNKNIRNILGLAYSGVAVPTTYVPFIETLTKAKMSDEFAMAQCGGDLTGSQIIFGGNFPEDVASGWEYTPIIHESYYVLSGAELSVKGYSYDEASKKWSKSDPGASYAIGNLPQYHHAEKGGMKTAVDSGSTMTLLPNRLYKKVVSLMKFANADLGNLVDEEFFEATAKKPTLYAMKIDVAKIKQFPTLTIKFPKKDKEGEFIDFDMKPLVYFKDFNNGKVTFGIREAEGVALLGQPFMENKLLHFDRKNSRIGFADNSKVCK